MVFIGHGLGVAFFMLIATLAATALWRTRTAVWRLPSGGVWAYLGGIMVLCKGLAALLYGTAAVPVMRWTKPRLQLRLAMVLVTLALLYPAFRAEDLVPTNYLVAVANSISEARAESLEFRFDHERALLERASQRLIFGWGRFGRSRIYDEWGKDISVTDGRWTITIGEFGLLGFLAEFGLLAWPVFRAASALRFAESERDQIFLAALALIVAITMINLLPNSDLNSLSWLLAGALLGRTEQLQSVSRRWRQDDRQAVAGREATVAGARGDSLPAP